MSRELEIVYDPDAESFWAGVDDGVIHLRHCDRCGTSIALPLPGCPDCGAVLHSPGTASSGLGSVYSWVVVRHAFDESSAGDVPYVVAAVDLDEGARIFARLDGAPVDALSPGLRVCATFPGVTSRPPIVFVPEEDR